MSKPTPRWRSLSFAVIPGVVLAALVLPPLLLLPRLPDPVATHWGLSGDPNGNVPIWLAFSGPPFLWLGHFLYLVIRGNDVRRGPSLRTAYSIAGLFLAVDVVILRANLDAPTWEQAETNVAIDLGLIALFTIAFSRGARLLEAHQPSIAKKRVEALRPSLGLGGTERAMWMGEARVVWWAAALGWGAAALSIFLIFLPLPLLSKVVSSLAFGVAAGAMITYSSVSVRISSAEVVVKSGPWGRARRIPLDSVREAQVIDVDPQLFGGFGYRSFSGGTGFIMRNGEALFLRRHEGNDLLVTVDDAATAAGLVNDLIQRDGGETST